MEITCHVISADTSTSIHQLHSHPCCQAQQTDVATDDPNKIGAAHVKLKMFHRLEFFCITSTFLWKICAFRCWYAFHGEFRNWVRSMLPLWKFNLWTALTESTNESNCDVDFITLFFTLSPFPFYDEFSIKSSEKILLLDHSPESIHQSAIEWKSISKNISQVGVKCALITMLLKHRESLSMIPFGFC